MDLPERHDMLVLKLGELIKLKLFLAFKVFIREDLRFPKDL